ncbi:esterase family protein [Micromonospora sp. C32]|uniref:alpha/beta hydrolase n=1 Tax=unclassified Micromonospora TaxID=2617518 RepID=UPI001B3932A1|nr:MULTISPECIES: alpha/beta hydrolase family protein [unclassified Micromonospora]MBQ1043062.1 esterase family protein [Micromonospora sp. C72]MBQ1056710.1 esterase family protein [Micromonospora sp. C32]
MAHIRCDFFSEALGMGTSMTVLLPDRGAAGIGMAASGADGDPPVLYLLHGLTDDDTAWTRQTSIERYVAALGLAVVMPQAHRSFYCDEAHGNRYWTFLSEELPEVCRSYFRLSDRREDTFVAGLSMGGYGAVKWALRRPERLAAAASLSGGLNVTRRRHHPTRPVDPAVWHTVWGDDPVPADDDTVGLLERSGDDLPALYVACGTEDFLYEDNLRFLDVARERDVPVTVDFGPDDHDWAYWDARIQDVLAWLPLRGR